MYFFYGPLFLISPIITFFLFYWAMRLAIRHEARRNERRNQPPPGPPISPPPPSY
jgi:hypothetical protein